MWKAGIAGLVALAAIGSSSALAGAGTASAPQARAAAQSETAPAQIAGGYAQIARLKSELKLTAEQEPLWPAVEKAFLEFARQQFEDGSQGLVRGFKDRATALGSNAVTIRRLIGAAYPLIRTLNDEQKQSALAFARSMGLETIAAAF